MKYKVFTKIIALSALLAFSGISQANLLVTVDLSVEDEITINATDGVALNGFESSDVLGVYLDNFFDTTELPLIETLLSGDFRHFGQATDNSPNLFRGSSNTDTGLNIWSMTPDADVTILAGQQVFAGSATFSLQEAMYDLMLSTAVSGMIYAPADSFDDLANAALIGSWEVIQNIVDVNVPSMLFLFGLPFAMLVYRKNC